MGPSNRVPFRSWQIALAIATSSMAFTAWVAVVGLPEEYHRPTVWFWDLGVFGMLPGMRLIRGRVGGLDSTAEWCLEIVVNGITWFSMALVCWGILRGILSRAKSAS